MLSNAHSFEALSLLTHRKHTTLCPAHYILPVPTVTRKDYLVIDLASDGFLSLFDIHNSEVTKDDIRAPVVETEVGERLRRLWGKVGKGEGDGEVWVVVLGVMGWEVVEGVRVGGGGE